MFSESLVNEAIRQRQDVVYFDRQTKNFESGHCEHLNGLNQVVVFTVYGQRFVDRNDIVAVCLTPNLAAGCRDGVRARQGYPMKAEASNG